MVPLSLPSPQGTVNSDVRYEQTAVDTRNLSNARFNAG
jgi:hypothetical protein